MPSVRPSTSEFVPRRNRRRQLLAELEFESSESDYDESPLVWKRRKNRKRNRRPSAGSSGNSSVGHSSIESIEEEERIERKKFLKTTLIRQFLDIFAPITFLAYLIVVTYISGYYVNPWLYGHDDLMRTMAVCTQIYSLAMILLNWILVCLVKTSLTPSEPDEVENSEKPLAFGVEHRIDSLYCETCKQPKPLRVHHCTLCKACILAREHHCYITSCCIGLTNLKFFVSFLLWLLAGSVYALVTIVMYLMSSEWKSSLYWYSYLFAPIGAVHYFLGLISNLELLLLLTVYCLIASLGLSAYLLGFHIFIASSGQTAYEYKAAIRPLKNEDQSRTEMLTSVFGTYWWLHLLAPVGLVGLIWADSNSNGNNNNSSDTDMLDQKWLEDDVEMLL